MSFDNFGSIEDLIRQRPSLRKNDDDETPHYDPRNDAEASRLAKVQASVDEKMRGIRLQNQEDETQAKGAQYGLQYISLEGFPIGPEVLSLITEQEALDHKIIPFFRLDNEIRLACVDPDDPEIQNIIANIQHQHTNAHVMLYITSPHSFSVAIRLYKTVAKVKHVDYGVKITADQLHHYQSELTSYDLLAKQLVKVNMTEAFAMIISMAMNAGTSDVHIEAEEQEAVIRFRIDGVLQEVASFPLRILGKLVSRIKVIAGLKINIDSVPQDGRISIKMGKTEDGSQDELDLRVSTLPSAFGESIVFRLLRSSSIGLSFADLGMRPLTFAKLKAEIEKPNGMIITTGPTGSGKTTTLYAILNTLNDSESKIITLENPIEYKLKGIVQSQIDHAKGYTFEKGLRAILRQDPDIVMVGEIRDFETAQTAIDAALTGHLMLSTIHTNDASGVVPRFLGMGVKGIFLAPALNAVIGQRLVRRICEQCKQPYTPPAEELNKAREWAERIPENSGEKKPDLNAVTFYKGVGCTECHKSGYKGRVGIYEVFTMHPKIEEQILSGKVSEFQMRDILHDAGMVTMGQDGLLKVIDGLTTLDEVFRVAKE